jgi:hypothetical protein
LFADARDHTGNGAVSDAGAGNRARAELSGTDDDLPMLPAVTITVPRRMTQAEKNEFDVQNGGIRPMTAAEGFFTFDPVGRGLKGAGTAAFDAWTALPKALGGMATLAGDAYGYASQAIAPRRSVLTGQPFAYQPQSALLQSVQQQGVLGTLGAGITGAVRSAPGIGLIGALGAPNRDWGNVGGQMFNTGLAGAGMAGAVGGKASRGSTTDLAMLSPPSKGLFQRAVDSVIRGDGNHVATFWGDLNATEYAAVRSNIGRTSADQSVLAAADNRSIFLEFTNRRPPSDTLLGISRGQSAKVFLQNTEGGGLYSLVGREVSGIEYTSNIGLHEGLHSLGVRGSQRAEALVRLEELRSIGVPIDRQAMRQVLTDMRGNYAELPWRAGRTSVSFPGLEF